MSDQAPEPVVDPGSGILKRGGTPEPVERVGPLNQLIAERDRLRTENATLRELVREALRGFLHGHDTNFIERAEKVLGNE